MLFEHGQEGKLVLAVEHQMIGKVDFHTVVGAVVDKVLDGLQNGCGWHRRRLGDWMFGLLDFRFQFTVLDFGFWILEFGIWNLEFGFFNGVNVKIHKMT